MCILKSVETLCSSSWWKARHTSDTEADRTHFKHEDQTAYTEMLEYEICLCSMGTSWKLCTVLTIYVNFSLPPMVWMTLLSCLSVCCLYPVSHLMSSDMHLFFTAWGNRCVAPENFFGKSQLHESHSRYMTVNSLHKVCLFYCSEILWLNVDQACHKEIIVKSNLKSSQV